MTGYGGEQPGIEWVAPAWTPPPPVPHADVVTHGRSRPPRVSRRTKLVVVAVVVAALASFGTWRLVRPTSALKVTAAGATVDNATPLLRTADTTFLAYVHTNLGVTSKRSHCFFDRVGGKVATDVGTTMYCGPVLFFDNRVPNVYVPFGLTWNPAGKAGHVVGSAKTTPNAASPVALPQGAQLVRPDHRTAPGGADGLSTPIPPQAQAGLLAAVEPSDIGSLPAAPKDAVMGSYNVGVRLVRSGTVSNYGHGVHERSAPAGTHLQAFVIDLLTGDSNFAPSTPKLAVSFDGGTPRRLPAPGDLAFEQNYVAAVPQQARSVDLLLTDAGVTQRLSLLTGTPAAGNIAVLRRLNRNNVVNVSGAADAFVDAGGQTFDAPLSIYIYELKLEYFTAYTAHPRSADRAFLYVDVCYSSSAFVDTASCHTFRGTDLVLTPTGGSPIVGRDIGKNNVGYVVFDVPATFTTGSLSVTGSESSGNGWSMTITQPYTYRVSMPA